MIPFSSWDAAVGITLWIVSSHITATTKPHDADIRNTVLQPERAMQSGTTIYMAIVAMDAAADTATHAFYSCPETSFLP